MDKNNPACYECPKGKSGLHTWSPIVEGDFAMTGAICLYCGEKLTKEQAEDVWRET